MIASVNTYLFQIWVLPAGAEVDWRVLFVLLYFPTTIFLKQRQN